MCMCVFSAHVYIVYIHVCYMNVCAPAGVCMCDVFVMCMVYKCCIGKLVGVSVFLH